jgi:hypothetical protein
MQAELQNLQQAIVQQQDKIALISDLLSKEQELTNELQHRVRQIEAAEAMKQPGTFAPFTDVQK